MITIKRAETIPADYGSYNGLITVTATGGKKPYMFSFDGGVNWTKLNSKSAWGGNHTIVVRDSTGAVSERREVKVDKVLSKVQAEYLNNLFDTFGNEAQAAHQTATKYDQRGKPIEFLLPKIVHDWRKDPDFAVFVRDIKVDANDYFKDYLEAKAVALVNGGIPIYQWIPNPVKREDEEGNVINDPEDRIRIQVGETLPDSGMIKFLLERRYKDVYSTRTEVTGKDGSNKIIAISLPDDFSFDDDEEEVANHI